MDNYEDLLLAEQANPNGFILEILSSKYEQWDCIYAVEGEEDKVFYYDFLKSLNIHSNFHFIICGGKDPLIRFKHEADNYNWNPAPKIKYLCDKDFDDYLERKVDGIWYTEYYSIESYLVNKSYIDYIVRKHSTRPIKEEAIKKIIDEYENISTSMIRSTRAYCAFACEVRAKGEHPDFDTFDISKIFDLSKPIPKKKRNAIEQATSALKVKSNIKLSDIIKRAKSFQLSDFNKWLRGKLALQIAKKSYSISKSKAPKTIRELLPGDNFFGSQGIETAFLHIKELKHLEEYCKE